MPIMTGNYSGMQGMKSKKKKKKGNTVSAVKPKGKRK